MDEPQPISTGNHAPATHPAQATAHPSYPLVDMYSSDSDSSCGGHDDNGGTNAGLTVRTEDSIHHNEVNENPQPTISSPPRTATEGSSSDCSKSSMGSLPEQNSTTQNASVSSISEGVGEEQTNANRTESDKIIEPNSSNEYEREEVRSLEPEDDEVQTAENQAAASPTGVSPTPEDTEHSTENSHPPQSKIKFADKVEVRMIPPDYSKELRTMGTETISFSAKPIRPRSSADQIQRLLNDDDSGPDATVSVDIDDISPLEEAQLAELDAKIAELTGSQNEDAALSTEEDDMSLAEAEDEREQLSQQMREERNATLRKRAKRSRSSEDKPEKESEAGEANLGSPNGSKTKIEKDREVELTSRFYKRQHKKRRLESSLDDPLSDLNHDLMTLAEQSWEMSNSSEGGDNTSAGETVNGTQH